MKIYIAGKITGDPDYRAKFADAQRQIEAQGHIVLNPATPWNRRTICASASP